jgi:redox-sensitive bicupin YhaK (pirin superfamily)
VAGIAGHVDTSQHGCPSDLTGVIRNGLESGSVEEQIVPRARDLGDGFTVQRALPARQRRTIGPFVFFDRMGPAGFGPGHGLDVRPHPHIGLATVTYLFEGVILHRDSLGTVQLIRPGEVNWMIAGRGIAHSERTPVENRQSSSRLSGIQLWVGLPRRDEGMEPLFAHHGAQQLPLLEQGGARLRLILGTLGGARSPVETLSPMFYADAQLQPEATFELDAEHPERALLLTEGALHVDAEHFEPGQLLVLRAGRRVRLRAAGGAKGGARLLLLGGTALDGPRYLWWNFVASSRERIQRASEAWSAGRFEAVPGDSELIPLPDTPLPAPMPGDEQAG